MDIQNKSTISEGIDSHGISFTSFLYLYGLNLVLRFPDVSTLEQLDQERVRSIARFVITTSRVGLEVWDEYCQVSQTQQQRMRPQQQTRVA